MPLVLERVAELSPFKGQETELRAFQYAAPAQGRGQKQRIYFALPGEEPITDGQTPDVANKVSYLVLDEDKALFLGMALNKALRGRGLGRHMLRYFEAHANSQELEVVGTVRINKPTIALTLQREGYEPVSDECLAEILPSDGDSLVPTIRFLNNTLPGSEIKDGFWGGKFYEIADPATVQDRPVDPDKVVALHLPYAPPTGV